MNKNNLLFYQHRENNGQLYTKKLKWVTSIPEMDDFFFLYKLHCCTYYNKHLLQQSWKTFRILCLTRWTQIISFLPDTILPFFVSYHPFISDSIYIHFIDFRRCACCQDIYKEQYLTSQHLELQTVTWIWKAS